MFTVEAETGINAPNYDECYIFDNGLQLDTRVIESQGNYLNMQSKTDTDKTNRVGVCCVLGERLDCSNFTTLLQCPLE
jgi:hypothetical protein